MDELRNVLRQISFDCDDCGPIADVEVAQLQNDDVGPEWHLGAYHRQAQIVQSQPLSRPTDFVQHHPRAQLSSLLKGIKQCQLTDQSINQMCRAVAYALTF